MQRSAKMSVCVHTLNTTTTTYESLTVFILNNLAFCQFALNQNQLEVYFDKMAKRMRLASLLDTWSSGKRLSARVQPDIILED